MATAKLSILFNAATTSFEFTDISDWVSQGIALANVKGNLKITSPSAVVLHNGQLLTAETGTAQTGGTGNITLAAGASATDDYYTGYFIKLTGGTGSGQIRKVTAYNGTTKVATIVNLWTTAPNNTSTYQFVFSDIALPNSYTPITGTAQSSGTTNNIVLAGGSSAVDDFYNGLYIKITAGQGAGQVRLISDYVGSTKTATVSEDWITQPDSSSTYEFNYSSFFNAATNLAQGDYPIPTLSNGDIEPGAYLFEYSVYDSNAATYYTVSTTYNYQMVFPSVTLSRDIDCTAPSITDTDTTVYTVNFVAPILDRAHKLFYPAINGSTTDAIVGSTATIITSVVYAPTSYTDYIKSNVTYSYPDNVYIFNSLIGGSGFDVECPADLCDIFCCLNTVYSNWRSNVCPNPTEANKYMNKFIQASAVASLIDRAVICGEDSQLASYAQTIKDITDCTGNCGCSDGSTPTLVTGTGSTATIVSVVSGNGILVNASTVGSTTTYTVNITPALITKINNSYSTTVSSSSNVVVTPSGSDPKNYDLTAPTVTNTDLTVTVTPIVNGDGITTGYVLSAAGTPNVLVDDFTATVSGAAGAYHSLSAKVFTLNYNVLKSTGDKLVIKQSITGDFLGATNKIQTLFGVSLGTTLYTNFVLGKALCKVVLEWNIVRLSNTTVEISMRAYCYSGTSGFLSSPVIIEGILAANPYTVSALDGTGSPTKNTMETQMFSTNTGGMTYQYQQVDVFKA